MSDRAAAGTKDASAHRRVVRNAACNIAGYTLTLAVAFFIAPLQVHKLGDTAYGIWVVLQELINYSLLLDFGIRIAVQREATRLHTLGQRQELNGMLSTACLLACVPAVLVLAGGAAAGLFFPHWFTTPTGLLTATRAALVLTAAALAVTFPGAIFKATVAALSRYDLVSMRNAVTQVARALLLWYFLTHGYGLISVAAIYFATVAAGQLLDLGFAFRLLPDLRLRIAWFRLAQMRSLFQFSAYAFLISFAVRLVFWSDNLVVAWGLGPVAVTFYAIAGGLVGYVRDGLTSLTMIYGPIAAHLDALGERESLRRMLVAGTRVGMLFVLPAIFGLWAAGTPFLRLWMGVGYARQSGPVLAWLTVTALICPLSATYSHVFYAMNRHRLSAWLALAEAGANITLSLILMRRLGIVGVAVGTVIPAVLDQVVIQPWYALRLLQVGRWRYYGQALLRPLAIAALPGAGLAALASRGDLAGWGSWFLSCVACTLAYGGMAWRWGLEAEEREILQRGLAEAGAAWGAWAVRMRGAAVGGGN